MTDGLSVPPERVVGLKQVLRALDKGSAAAVYLAQDADEPLRKRVQDAARAAGVPVTDASSMKQLGESCGIEISAACAARLKPQP